ncbi:MAG: hypothetical protein R2806_24580 [Saprospiraceae bacterium]
MQSNSFAAVLLFILSMTAGCQSLRNLPALPLPAQEIACAPGPEDIALDTFDGRERLIVSTDQRRNPKGQPRQGGQLQYIDIRDDQTYPFALTGYPCEKIYPHGIDLVYRRDSLFLYVLSHHPLKDHPDDYNHHLIHRFLVRENQLIWLDSLSSSLLCAPNDLFVLPDGRIYVTNYMKRISTFQTLWTALLRFRTGSIAYYLPGEGWQKVSGRYGYPNGILVREHHLYIAEGTRKHLLRFDLDEQGHPQPHPIHSARKFLFADNLMPGPEGWLYGTCHPRPLRFKAHAGDPGKRSPSSLYKISPDFEDWEWIGQDDGGRISAASTCLPYHGQLYVSQVFDGFILKMPYTKGQ